MSKFVKFHASGFTSKGEYRSGSGVVLDSHYIMGKIFAQCPDLLPVVRLVVRTTPI